MAQNVADVMWEMLAKAGVKRCYGIVGDALNPVIDALRRNGQIEFIHVRHEEYGVFAAVAVPEQLGIVHATGVAEEELMAALFQGFP